MSYLSECIRKGSKIIPNQSFLTWIHISELGLHACAMGAALIGADERLKLALLNCETDGPGELVLKFFPGISDESNAYRKCPAQECDLVMPNSRSLLGYIIHLNDLHQWSRERIADWIDSLEPSEEAVTEAEMVCA